MTTCEIVKKRIDNLLAEKKMSLYRLGLNSGVLPGTLNGIMKLRNKSVDLSIATQIAHGFGMELWEFFNDPLFKAEQLQ